MTSNDSAYLVMQVTQLSSVLFFVPLKLCVSAGPKLLHCVVVGLLDVLDFSSGSSLRLFESFLQLIDDLCMICILLGEFELVSLFDLDNITLELPFDIVLCDSNASVIVLCRLQFSVLRTKCTLD